MMHYFPFKFLDKDAQYSVVSYLVALSVICKNLTYNRTYLYSQNLAPSIMTARHYTNAWY